MALNYGQDSTSLVTVDKTQKFCPFQPISQTTTDGTTTYTGVYCIKGMCQLWVETEIKNDKFSSLYGLPSPYLDETSNESGRCGAQTSDYSELSFRLLHHMHHQHMHTFNHKVNTISELNSNYLSNYTSLSNVLLQEYFSQEDLNNDGKIFGKDFEILKDSNIPLPLISIYEVPTYVSSNIKIPWDIYSAENGPFYPAVIKKVYNSVSVDGGDWLKIDGYLFVDDSSVNSIKPNNIDSSSFYITINNEEIDTYFIHDSTTLYIQTPDVDSTGVYDITIHNWGDTFDTGKFTGYPRTWNNLIRYLDSSNILDQSSIISEMEDLGYL